MGETCWTISNITAGTAEQIQQVISANLIPPLVNILKEDQFDVQKEAAWAIANITSGGNEDQTQFLVSQASIPALCAMFNCGDTKMIIVVLDALEDLQRHENEEIYEKSVKILQVYFESEEDDNMGMAPEIDQSTGQFAFGASTAAKPAQFAF